MAYKFPMKVSIIIPTYNVEAYIVECLESVARQTYQGALECLIVDDCGTDNSISKAEDFIHAYLGDIDFRILHHHHNRGLSAARNTGVEAATGDYVYFLDSDDSIIPEAIESMVNIVQNNPQIEMVQGGILNMSWQAVDDFTMKGLPEYTDNVEWIAKNMLFNLPVSSWNRLLKRDFLLNERIIFHEGIIHEDVPYNFLLAMKCRSVGFVRKNTYLFRPQREGSITNTPQEKRALRSRLIIMHDCIDAFRFHSFESETIQNIALCALWKKWQIYMTIHSHEILAIYSSEISDVSKLMCRITPWPTKALAVIQSLLPLRYRHFIKIK